MYKREEERINEGEPVIYMNPRTDGQQYKGTILHVDKEQGYCVQLSGKHSLFVHSLDKLERVPEVGENLKVSYPREDGHKATLSLQDSPSQTHEDHRRIFEELKRQEIFEQKASAKPKAIIVCGQPGSGRSSQISMIMQEFSGSGAVLLEESEMQNQPQSLFEEALHGRMNLVIKSTLPNDEMLKKLREEGYTTSVYVVSAHERESLLSQYQKYEGQLATRAIGDKPNISEHDEIYMKLPETLQRIEEEGLIDEIVIRDRKGNEKYRNHQTNGRWENELESSRRPAILFAS